jgi:copper chaperone CopZ
VRSALLSVKGVTRARVTLENWEAVVTFDANQASVDELIKAVGNAEGPAGPNQYSATVKSSKPGEPR